MDIIHSTPPPNVYINTISNINDWGSLIRFYDLMFSGHPFVFMTVVFIGLYGGLMMYEHYKKEVIHDDCNKT